jgi:hypothetical protein
MSDDLETMQASTVHAGEDGEDHVRPRRAWSQYAAAAAAVAVAVAVVLALVVLSLIVDAVTWVGSATGGSAWWAAVRRVGVDPLGRWVAQHHGDLPWSASSLTAAWWLLGGVLFLASLVEITAARVGWVLFGAGTAAAVYAGTAAPAQPVAAATVGAAWLVLSLLALHGPGVRRPPVTVAGDPDSPGRTAAGVGPVLAGEQRGRGDVAQPSGEHARLSRTFELLLQRRAARARHAGTGHPQPHWTIHSGEGNAFTARCCTGPADASGAGAAPGWEAAGLAFSPDALTEVLTLIHPAGTTPTLRWERDELRPALWTRGMEVEPPGLPPIDEFLQNSAEQRARLVECLRARQEAFTGNLGGELSLGALGSRFLSVAERLNISRALLPDVGHLQPLDSDQRDFVGSASFYDWVEVTTIVQAGKAVAGTSSTTTALTKWPSSPAACWAPIPSSVRTSTPRCSTCWAVAGTYGWKGSPARPGPFTRSSRTACIERTRSRCSTCPSSRHRSL